MQQLLVEKLLQLCCLLLHGLELDVSLIMIGFCVLAQQRCLNFYQSDGSLKFLDSSTVPFCQRLTYNLYFFFFFFYQVVPFFCCVLFLFSFLSLILHRI